MLGIMLMSSRKNIPLTIDFGIFRTAKLQQSRYYIEDGERDADLEKPFVSLGLRAITTDRAHNLAHAHLQHTTPIFQSPSLLTINQR